MSDQIDVLALHKEEKLVADGLMSLKAMYGASQPDAFFWKAVTTFSYRLVAVGGVEECVKVLSMAPPEYFRGIAIEQMAEDPLYAELTKRMADKLVEAGKVERPYFEFDIRKTDFTDKLGRA